MPALATAVVLLLSMQAGAPRGDIIDRILAIVDTHIITLSDVRAAQTFRLVPPDVSTDPTGAALQRLIDRRLMLAEVERYAPPEPTEAAITARMAEIERRFTDALGLEIALGRSAMTREELRRQIRDTLRIEAYLQQRFATTVQVSDEDVVRYYREHGTEFMRDGQLRPFDDVRETVRVRALEAHRETFLRQWVEGLRRRGAVQLLYLPPVTGK